MAASLDVAIDRPITYPNLADDVVAFMDAVGLEKADVFGYSLRREDVKAMKTPVLIITGDADVAALEHSVATFRLLGSGIMDDMGKALRESRLAVLPATSHTAVITQPELLHALIEPFLKGEMSI